METKKRATTDAMTPKTESKDIKTIDNVQELPRTYVSTAPHFEKIVRHYKGCHDRYGFDNTTVREVWENGHNYDDVAAGQKAVDAAVAEALAKGLKLRDPQAKAMRREAKNSQRGVGWEQIGDRQKNTPEHPNGIILCDDDKCRLSTDQLMSYGAMGARKSLAQGTHSLWLYDEKNVTTERAFYAVQAYLCMCAREEIELDPCSRSCKQFFYLSGHKGITAEKSLYFDKALCDALLCDKPSSEVLENPTPPRTRTTEPPRPKRGRPSNNEIKMQRFVELIEGGDGFEDPIDPMEKYNPFAFAFFLKTAGVGISKEVAKDWFFHNVNPEGDKRNARDDMNELTTSAESAYNDIAVKEVAKAKKRAEEREKLRDKVGVGSIVDVRGKDYYVARDGSISIRSPLWAKDYLGGKDLYSMRPSFEGFIHAPDNLNFSYVVDDLFNIAAQVPKYEPKGNPTPSIDALLAHIFGAWGDDDNGVQRGLDWVQIAYTDPAQKLPILVLTSIEQGTGKTSFLQFLKLLFGRAAVDADVSSVTGQFTSHWAHAQIVMIDEQATNSREQAGFLKKYSTAKTLRYEAKGAAAEFVDFFGKFVIANNHEERPVYLEEEDTRYVVLPVPSLVGNSDPEFMTRVEAEMGDFVAMLRDRELHTPKRGRLWFAPEDLETEATRKAKRSSRSTMHEALDAMLDSMSEQLPDEPLIFTSKTYRMYVERIEDLQWRQDSARIALERKGVQKRSQRHIVLSDWSIEESEKWELRKADSIRCWLITRRSDR